MLDMSSIMPIFTTPSEIFSCILSWLFSWDCAAKAHASRNAAPIAIAADLFIVTSPVAGVLKPAYSKQRHIEVAGLLRRCAVVVVVFYPPGARMVAGPAVAVPDFMLAHQGDQTNVLLVLRQRDVTHAVTDPRAASGRTVAEFDDLQKRQPVLDHL